MNWNAISAVAEALGAIGVVVTLLYISRQVRENNIRTWMTRPGIVRWLDELGSHVHPSFRRFITTLPPDDS